MFKLRILGALIAACMAPTFSYAGNSTGGGGEFITTGNNPWFIGPESIRYCVDIDHGAFSVDDAAVDAALNVVFVKWSETLASLKLRPTPDTDLDGVPKNLTTTFTKVSCGQSAELRFVLGRHTRMVDELLLQYARYTVGFAKQTAFDEATGRAKGIVWLAGDRGQKAYMGPHDAGDFWGNGKRLYNVLLHEMGHVFGFGHSDTGAMNENVPAWAVQDPTSFPYSIQDKILQQWQQNGVPVSGGFYTNELDSMAYFSRLFGYDQWQVPKALLETIDNSTFKLTLTLKNQPVGSWTLAKVGEWIHLHTPLDTISGQYQKHQPLAADAAYPDYHWFLQPSPSDLLLSGTINARPMQFVVHTINDRLRIDTSGDGQGPHYFEIGFPLVEGE